MPCSVLQVCRSAGDGQRSKLACIASCTAALVLGVTLPAFGQESVTPPEASGTYVAAAAPLLAAELGREATGTLPEAELGGEWMPVDAGSGLGDSTAVAESASDAVELVETRDAGHAGRWRVSPHLLLSGTYDDNIFIQHTDPVGDFIVTAAAGLAFGFWDGEGERERFLDRNHFSTTFERSRGNLFLVDYTAIGHKFIRNGSEDSLDHDGLFQARWHQEKLTLAAGAHLESKTETNIDVGDRIRRKTAATNVSVRYEMTDRTAFGLEGAYVVNDPEAFIGNRETRGEATIDYAATPVTAFGIGVAAGVVDPDFGADQTFERIVGRVHYALTDKVDFSFRGGAELRQFERVGGGDRVNPIFELRAVWLPAAGTELAADAFRRVETSAALVEEDFETTGFALTFRREVRTGLHLSLAGGYQNVRYRTANTTISRMDDYFYIRPALVYNFATWGNAAISYEHRQNDSDRTVSSFTNNLTTVQVGFQY